jgi:hypothetical protein
VNPTLCRNRDQPAMLRIAMQAGSRKTSSLNPEQEFMKKLLFIVTLLLAFGFTGWWIFRPSLVPPTSATATRPTKITITYDSGLPLTFTPALPASTSALTLLENVTRDSNIPLETKKYSFGTLVESINGLKNTPDKAWIYFVNGASAAVGADSYQVQPGDVIDWKYVTPQF